MCCLHITFGEDKYAFGQAGNSSVQWPVQATASEDHRLIIIVAPSVGTIAVIIGVILAGMVIVAIAMRCRSRLLTPQHPINDKQHLVSASPSVV